MVIRCEKCNKLLTIVVKGVNIEMEIKCVRCKHTNSVKIESIDEKEKKPNNINKK